LRARAANAAKSSRRKGDGRPGRGRANDVGGYEMG
jgi:hypothetical protein